MSKTKLLGIIFIIAAVAIIALTLMRQWEPTQQLVEPVFQGFDTLKTYVTDNLPTVLAAGGTVASIGGAALSQVNKAKDQVTEIKNAAGGQIASLTDEKDKLAAQVSSVKDELTTLKTQNEELMAAKDEFERVKAENKITIDSQRRQLEDLMKMLENRPVEIKKVVG